MPRLPRPFCVREPEMMSGPSAADQERRRGALGVRVETLRGEGRAASRRARRSPAHSADGGRHAARGGRARVGFGRPVGTVRERRRRRAVVGVDGRGGATGGVAAGAHRGMECTRARRRRHRRPPAPISRGRRRLPRQHRQRRTRVRRADRVASACRAPGYPQGVGPRGHRDPHRSDGDLAGDAVLVHARRPPGFAVVDAARRVGRGPRRRCRARAGWPGATRADGGRVSPRSANRVPAHASRSSSRSPSAGRSRATG